MLHHECSKHGTKPLLLSAPHPTVPGLITVDVDGVITERDVFSGAPLSEHHLQVPPGCGAWDGAAIVSDFEGGMLCAYSTSGHITMWHCALHTTVLARPIKNDKLRNQALGCICGSNAEADESLLFMSRKNSNVLQMIRTDSFAIAIDKINDPSIPNGSIVAMAAHGSRPWIIVAIRGEGRGHGTAEEGDGVAIHVYDYSLITIPVSSYSGKRKSTVTMDAMDMGGGGGGEKASGADFTEEVLKGKLKLLATCRCPQGSLKSLQLESLCLSSAPSGSFMSPASFPSASSADRYDLLAAVGRSGLALWPLAAVSGEEEDMRRSTDFEDISTVTSIVYDFFKTAPHGEMKRCAAFDLSAPLLHVHQRSFSNRSMKHTLTSYSLLHLHMAFSQSVPSMPAICESEVSDLVGPDAHACTFGNGLTVLAYSKRIVTQSPSAIRVWTYESCERGYGIANSQPVGAVELSHPSALIAYNDLDKRTAARGLPGKEHKCLSGPLDDAFLRALYSLKFPTEPRLLYVSFRQGRAVQKGGKVVCKRGQYTLCSCPMERDVEDKESCGHSTLLSLPRSIADLASISMKDPQTAPKNTAVEGLTKLVDDMRDPRGCLLIPSKLCAQNDRAIVLYSHHPAQPTQKGQTTLKSECCLQLIDVSATSTILAMEAVDAVWMKQDPTKFIAVFEGGTKVGVCTAEGQMIRNAPLAMENSIFTCNVWNLSPYMVRSNAAGLCLYSHIVNVPQDEGEEKEESKSRNPSDALPVSIRPNRLVECR